ncbi:MAG TPA: hypothetical protein VHQ90_25060 [Thermoanaerobaculia bacterium]|nr:hypothetical protein [Thermoanaerobaculia bacterium]
MIGNIAASAAADCQNSLAFWTFIVTTAGVLILTAYTVAAFWQAILTRRAIREARESREEAAAATLRSNEATEESNRIAERSLELGRRAWVIMTGMVAPTKFNPGEPLRIKTTMRNSGGVPATNVISKLAIAIIPSTAQLPDEPPPTHGEEFFAVVPVGRPVKGLGIFDGLSESEANGIESGRDTLYFVCRIDYTDTFRKPRWSIACWRYAREFDRWVVAAKHNHAE